MLRGKYKPSFTPHADCGDNVIVLNADKIKLTGDKWNKKTYIRHTGYPGGQRSLTASEIHEKDSTRLVEKSIKGMLPKTNLERNCSEISMLLLGLNILMMAKNQPM